MPILNHPFTEDELTSALLPVLSPESARSIISALLGEEMLARLAADGVSEEERNATAIDVEIPDEILQLLSLVSPETKARVDTYRAERNLGPFSENQRNEWESRLELVRAAMVHAGKLPPVMRA